MELETKCLLCGGLGEVFLDTLNQKFFKCKKCKGIFVPPQSFPDKKTEIERYLSHNNDVEDLKYQQFVAPIINEVIKDFDFEHSGLDYGAGTGPVITKLLRDKKYKIFPYDPFFADDEELLKQQYNFIVCCEVMEHFHDPEKEFKKLKTLLKPQGKLYCMTHIYSPEIEFSNWYYKNDPTHVFIYQKETFNYIAETIGFSASKINNRLVVFSL